MVCEQVDPQFDMSLIIDKTKLPQPKKVKKTMNEETKAQTKEENTAIKEEIEKIAEDYAKRIACFKRDYVGAPIYAAMKAAQSGEKFEAVEVPYRSDEKYWVFSDKGEVTVIFGLNFHTDLEKVLARIVTIELKNNAGVANSAGITFHDKVEDRPENLKFKFPKAMKESYTNGMVSMKLSKTHLDKGLNQPLTFLVGFRQYVQYHLHGMKTQIHSRLRLRVNAFENVIKQARRDKEQPKNWYENFGGATHADSETKEESKQGEVYKHTE